MCVGVFHAAVVSTRTEKAAKKEMGKKKSILGAGDTDNAWPCCKRSG